MINPVEGFFSQTEYNHHMPTLSSDDINIKSAWSKVKIKKNKKIKIHAWTYHKTNNRHIGGCYSRSQIKIVKKWAERMLTCGNFVSYAYEKMDDGTLKYKRSIALVKLCKVRTCPICQWRRSLQLTATIGTKLRQVLADNPHLTAYMVSLTVLNVNVEQLNSEIKLMCKAWHKLTRRVAFKNVVTHWVRTIEVTAGARGVVGDTHPHIHAILIVDKSKMPVGWDNKDKWRLLWQNVAKLDYLPQIDIKPVRNTGGAICECLKYCVKPSANLAKSGWLENVALQLINIRLLGVSKTLNDIVDNLTNTDTAYVLVDNLPDGIVAEGNTIIINYRWDNKNKQYKRHSIKHQSLADFKLNAYFDACSILGIVPKQLRQYGKLYSKLANHGHHKAMDMSIKN